MAAAVAAGLLPAAVLLAVLGARGAVSWGWVIAAIAAGAIGGWIWIAAALKALRGRAERFAAIGEALEQRRSPTHLVTDEADALGRAERQLVDASDAVIDDLNSLTEQRDEFEAILRGMTEAVVVTRPDGAVVLLNRAARTLFALPDEAPVRARDFVELCRDPRLQEFVARSMRSADGGVISAQITIENPAHHDLDVNAAPVRNARGDVTAWVLVFHDITKLRTYETVRADFIENLTHELRTPLSALCGYAETLVRGVDDPATRRRFLTIIERQSRRLARLIDDLITLSDLERGLTPLKFEPLDVRKVLDDAAELMRQEARRAGVALEVECPDGLPKLFADHDRMQQVLLNLLDNAIKYTPREGRVTLRAFERDGGTDGRAGVALAVADTGEGIPAADIPRLTERFYRVDRARSRELGGTGLGLAIVKHIVQLHRGSLQIESKLREGTTVTVWIPAAEQALSPAQAS
jgi:two-component system phosphate regulon sensor histidine kinase PhoR